VSSGARKKQAEKCDFRSDLWCGAGKRWCKKKKLTGIRISAKYGNMESGTARKAGGARGEVRRHVLGDGNGTAAADHANALVGTSRGLVVGDIQGNWRFPIRRCRIIGTSSRMKSSCTYSAESTFLRYTANTEALQELLAISLFRVLHAKQSAQTARRSGSLQVVWRPVKALPGPGLLGPQERLTQSSRSTQRTRSRRYTRRAAWTERTSRKSLRKNTGRRRCGKERELLRDGGRERDELRSDYFYLYDAAQMQQIPGEALQASLGCGNPTALAKLNPGEIVLDLGSGGRHRCPALCQACWTNRQGGTAWT